jgi:DNA-directed RNA polymerase subunit H (RpoH/RPB5)
MSTFVVRLRRLARCVAQQARDRGYAPVPSWAAFGTTAPIEGLNRTQTVAFLQNMFWWARDLDHPKRPSLVAIVYDFAGVDALSFRVASRRVMGHISSMAPPGPTTILMMSWDGLNVGTAIAKILADLNAGLAPAIRFELWNSAALLYVPTTHIDVPPHRRLDWDGADRATADYLRRAYGANVWDELPLLKVEEKMARWLALRPGDIVEILRYDPSKGENRYWRRVGHTPLSLATEAGSAAALVVKRAELAAAAAAKAATVPRTVKAKVIERWPAK